MSNPHALTAAPKPIRLVRWLMLLCAFDALATDIGLRLQLVVEVNPLARVFYETSPVLFYSIKAGLPIVLYVLVTRIPEHSFIRQWLLAAAAAYGAVTLYHIGLFGYIIAYLVFVG